MSPLRFSTRLLRRRFSSESPVTLVPADQRSPTAVSQSAYRSFFLEAPRRITNTSHSVARDQQLFVRRYHIGRESAAILRDNSFETTAGIGVSLRVQIETHPFQAGANSAANLMRVFTNSASENN